MKVIVDKNPIWKSVVIGEYSVHYAGYYRGIFHIIKSIVELGIHPKLDNIDSLLSKLTTPAAVVMESKHTIIAFTDQFCCYPLFYTTVKGGYISNNARSINTLIENNNWNILSVEEFSMTGYVTGSETLKQDLKNYNLVRG